jgi:hypothetical protein
MISTIELEWETHITWFSQFRAGTGNPYRLYGSYCRAGTGNPPYIQYYIVPNVELELGTHTFYSIWFPLMSWKGSQLICYMAPTESRAGTGNSTY